MFSKTRRIKRTLVRNHTMLKRKLRAQNDGNVGKSVFQVQNEASKFLDFASFWEGFDFKRL
eukprot:UN21049